MGNFAVSLKRLVEKVSLEVIYTPCDLDKISVEIAEVNRPGLFLAGYYDYFDKLRLQIMGLAEMNFLAGLTAEKRRERLDQLFRQQPPAVILCRNEELEPFPEMQELAKQHGVALLRSNETTCTMMGSLISVLNLELAPRITRHGVLVEVYGEGILILGDSGIGKSELAIELVKRGHRLVADDAVEIRHIGTRLVGSAPELIRHYIELRGIGVVDIQQLFGMSAVLEEQAINLVGTDIYEKLVKHYTEKQWGRDCKDLPAFIIKRLPVRLTFDNNYFNALYQGIPNGGYTAMVEKMLDGVEVRLGVDYLAEKAELDKLADRVVYTGPVDAYFGYKLGALQYRSVRFETETLDTDNYQGNAVVNYTDAETPYTRIIEHKHFEFGTQPKTVISREYSAEWNKGDEPYYPVNDAKNGALYAEYKQLADAEPGVIFGGRLGEYKYYDMDKVIEAALDVVGRELA